jgi:hypothetical protein
MAEAFWVTLAWPIFAWPLAGFFSPGLLAVEEVLDGVEPPFVGRDLSITVIFFNDTLWLLSTDCP